MRAHIALTKSCANSNCSRSSPQGRIFQIEYAAEAVKQGSVVVGLTSKTHAVLCAIKVRPARVLLVLEAPPTKANNL